MLKNNCVQKMTKALKRPRPASYVTSRRWAATADHSRARPRLWTASAMKQPHWDPLILMRPQSQSLKWSIPPPPNQQLTTDAKMNLSIGK